MQNIKPKWQKVTSLKKIGVEKTYDITVKNNHNFLANNILVHNCFQEDVMTLGNKMAGLSLDECDTLRKVVSKKPVPGTPKYEKMKKAMDDMESKFVQGSVENGVGRSVAQDLFDQIKEFAKYSFNKCLHQNTKVETPNGLKDIRHIKNGDFVNSKNGMLRVLDVIQTKPKKMITVCFSSGHQITCTEDHKFETNDGKMTTIKEVIDSFYTDRELMVLTVSGWSKVKSYENCGEHECWDIEVDHEDHTFFADGVSVSNSHAVSYAINSYICAWFLTYYEAEWLCTNVEACQASKIKKPKSIAELKSFGYDIAKVDINHADRRWVILDGKKAVVPSFGSCKGIGDKAVDEVLKNRPYKDIWEFLYNEDGTLKHSKFNKKCVDVLIRSEGFDSLDCVGPNKVFSSYAQMHKVLIENWDLVKKKLKKDTLESQIEKVEKLVMENESCEPWSKKERMNNFKTITGQVNVNIAVDVNMQEKLLKKGYESSDDLSEKEEGQYLIWFIISKIELKQTRTGKDYAVLTVVGSAGNENQIRVWNWDSDANIEECDPYIAVVKKDGFGVSTKLGDMRSLAK